jgi:hypothetical protein
VITKHGCGETTTNQVVALDAGGDLSTYNADTGDGALWTFNNGDRLMDYGSSGCSIDYERNQLYCGTNLTGGYSQPTVWAIYTGNDNSLGAAPHTAGNQAWALNASSVRNRPQLGKTAPAQVYVADFAGSLHAIDPATGTQHWAVNVSASATNVTQDVWAEFRTSYDHLVFVTDTSGVMHMIFDGFDGAAGTGSVLWNKSYVGHKVMSLAGVAPTPGGKVYLGLDNGTMHQLNLGTRADESTLTVGGVADTVMDPTFDIQGGGVDINKMITVSAGAGGGTVKQFTIPWGMATGASNNICDTMWNPANPNLPDTVDKCQNSDNSPPGCVLGGGTGPDCCAVGRCIPNNGISGPGLCGSFPRTDTPGACDDGYGGCTTNKVCKSGGCVGQANFNNPLGSCPPTLGCQLDPSRGCGASQSCNCVTTTYLPGTGGQCPGSPCNAGDTCNPGTGMCQHISCTCITSSDGSGTVTSTYQNGGQCPGSPCTGNDQCVGGQCQLVWHPCGTLSQSCDDRAPAGVDTHGGNRTCNNGVCGRELDFCTMPADADFTVLDNQSVPAAASRNASYLAFDRVFSALNGSTTCNGWLSSYSSTFSTANVIQQYTGGSCNFCGNANSTPVLGGTSAPTLTFNDNNAPNTITALRVTVQGGGVATLSCVAWQVELRLNGVLIFTSALTGSCPSCNGSCNTLAVKTISGAPTIPQCPAAGGAPCWNYGGANTVDVKNLSGLVDLAQVQIRYNDQTPVNLIHRVIPGAPATAQAFPATTRPGFLHGVLPQQQNTGTGSTALVFTSIINSPTSPNEQNPALWDFRGNGTVGLLTGATQPTAGACTGNSCPFVANSPVWNFGPSPPGGDGIPIQNSGVAGTGLLYYADYFAQGDVVQVTSAGSTYTATSIGSNSSPAANKDWTGLVDMPPKANTKSDTLLRMSHGATIDFFQPDAKNRGFVYILDLNSSAAPNSTVGPPGRGGVGPMWFNAGMQYITAVTGLAVDPLNQTNNTFAEVREQRPVADPCGGVYTYTVLIHGSDHTVRPLADYTDWKCNTIPGVYTVLGLPTATYTPPAMNQVTAPATNEGRITAGSVSYWHRIVPGDPSVTANASIVSGRLPP